MNIRILKKPAAIVFLWLNLLHFAGAAPTVHVTPDERVDLISIVFHYAGNEEFGKIFIPEYAEAMEIRFADFKTHPVIETARKFHQKHRIGYNAIADLAIHLASPDSMRLIDGPLASLDPRWPREELEAFLAQLRDFARQSKFSEFYAAQLPLYRAQCEFWQKKLEESGVVPWVKRFYGDPRPLHFIVAPSVLENGGVGPSVELDGEFYCYMVSMIIPLDHLKDPAMTPELKKIFDIRISNFLAHEFSHPWTNPVTEAIYPQIQSTAEKVFPACQDTMKQQAYGTPEVMMIETFNRAAESIYLHDQYGEEAAEKHVREQKNSGFMLIERVYRCILTERQKGAASWRFADGAQAYADCVNAEESRQILDEFLRTRKAATANAPAILSMSPANGARNVDPATTDVVITFSKPMKRGMSVCRSDSGAAPKFTSATYDGNATILTLKLQPEPDTEYRIWLNRGEEYRNFTSSDGGVLPDTEYVFHTGPAR